ncbi:hypothetical protein DOT_2582 [Desulfosporosinus sp. OT]|nr:hypothetical protein DOT_2582 [Desulfosporosinus sp. OT]
MIETLEKIMVDDRQGHRGNKSYSKGNETKNAWMERRD